MTTALPSAYDSIAHLYNKLWADWYLPSALPALEQLFFRRVPVASRILDLCCGSGHVTKELVDRGYRVTGIDNSSELIEIARRLLPSAEFSVQDASDFRISEPVDAALSTFDSLNHIVESDRLARAFACTHASLKAGGLFVFDMNLEEAYATDLQQWTVERDDSSVSLVRGTYNPADQLASTELIWFAKNKENDCWRRETSIVKQRCYAEADILDGVAAAGFTNIEVSPAPALGVQAGLAYGRIFVSAMA